MAAAEVLYHIKPSANKGFGMFAEKDITPGTEILRERPVVSCSGDLDSTIESLEPAVEEHLCSLDDGTSSGLYKHLSLSTRKHLRTSLRDRDGKTYVDTLKSLYLTNSFEIVNFEDEVLENGIVSTPSIHQPFVHSQRHVLVE